MKILRLALAQMNSTVGDLRGNSRKISEYIRKAKRCQADLVAFPELVVTGYPPEDLVLKRQFIADNISEVERLSSAIQDITAIIGFVDESRGKNIHNAAAIVSDRKIIDSYHKIILPNYGVFDEHRYFIAGKRLPLYDFDGIKVGVTVCEDIWHRNGPLHTLSRSNADIIININASPYERGKPQKREEMLRQWAAEKHFVIAYLNAVGGQDELVFDGFSMVYDHTGNMIARGKQFEEDLLVVDIDIGAARKDRKVKKDISASVDKKSTKPVQTISLPMRLQKSGRRTVRPRVSPFLSSTEEIYRALMLGTADYVRKNDFPGVVIGLSGGIDSSLVAVLSVDAIGKERVNGLFMPSQYTSKESREDAFALAQNLGISVKELPIDGIFDGYFKVLKKEFREYPPDATEENLQARIRGNLLMAFSNKFGWLVLATGNKSEMSVGYATLYGDMAGGFAVIKDVSKTLVYDLCAWRNSQGEYRVIPNRVLRKEPTAELKHDQRDTDTLPPYPELDPILKAYIEDEMSFEDIRKIGFQDECTQKVIRMIDQSEYKRRQAPPGIKISGRAFGRDRRFPITNKYRSF
ncbi:MAG: NAD+ synthase [Nitrospiraceae bacterium]|nr:MAG: NAD+ synthase [Nitrospiraceae bacterium]